MKHLFWIFSNLYAYIFGFPLLAAGHHAIMNLCLHALGYDNAYKSFSGEEWFIRHILKPAQPKVCIDVGANVGKYTSLLLKHLDAQVYALEPSSSAFQALQYVVKAADGRVHAEQVALANYNGSATLFSKTDRATTATISETLGSGSAIKETVLVSTLDSFIEKNSLQHVDFIKIDTEGYEAEVMQGMAKTLLNLKPKYIQFEFNILHLQRHTTLYELTNFLIGYRFYRLLPHGMIEIDPRKYLDNIFMFSNIVAIRK